MHTNNQVRVLESLHSEMSIHLLWCGKIKGLMQVIWQKIHKFRSTPKMQMNSFVKTIKEDCMYEILKHQF